MMCRLTTKLFLFYVQLNWLQGSTSKMTDSKYFTTTKKGKSFYHVF